MVLDFNFAYNPSCAYHSRWVCPLAPPENKLPFPVRAGEKLFKGSPHAITRKSLKSPPRLAALDTPCSLITFETLLQSSRCLTSQRRTPCHRAE
jgi:hypothetical protein